MVVSFDSPGTQAWAWASALCGAHRQARPGQQERHARASLRTRRSSRRDAAAAGVLAHRPCLPSRSTQAANLAAAWSDRPRTRALRYDRLWPLAECETRSTTRFGGWRLRFCYNGWSVWSRHPLAARSTCLPPWTHALSQAAPVSFRRGLFISCVTICGVQTRTQVTLRQQRRPAPRSAIP